MSRPISNVVDIKPVIKSWTVLIQVLESVHVLNSFTSGSEFKRLVLTDSQGTMVSTIIYMNNLRYFTKLLTQYKRYYISNAGISETDAKFRIDSYLYSWTLNNRTLVEEFTDSIPVTLPCQFNFTKFADLHKYADTDRLLNVRAIVLKCFPSKEQGSEDTTRRDIVLVDEEKKPLLLTLWNQFDQKEGNALADVIESAPMIFGMRLKVTTFNGLSLTTRGNSGFMINPPVTGGLLMQDWYNNHKDELQLLIRMKSYKDSDMLLPYPKDIDIVSIATFVASLKTVKTSWIKGKTSFPRQQRSSWYTVCANCQKSLDSDLSWIVTCPSCRLESEVQAMSRLTILIEDGTGSICPAIHTPDAEKLMPVLIFMMTLPRRFNNIRLLHFIRTYEATFHGQTEMKMNVVKSYLLGEVVSTPKLAILPANQTTVNLPSDQTTTILQEKKQASKSTMDVAIPISSKEKEQLFSPTTKLVIEDISSAIASKQVKRSLSFSHEGLRSETITPINKPQATLIEVKKEIGDQLSAKSPSKKTNNLVAITKKVGSHVTDESPTKKAKDC